MTGIFKGDARSSDPNPKWTIHGNDSVIEQNDTRRLGFRTFGFGSVLVQADIKAPKGS